MVRLITLAPELPGAAELIASAVRRQVQVSAGHTDATYEQIRQAVEWGVRHSTHTFNRMSGLHHRQPGAVGAVLTDDRIYAELIADGVHLHPAIVSLLVRAKGIDHITLVTDAMRATGLEDGGYDLGGQTIHVRNGVARTHTGNLPGSDEHVDLFIAWDLGTCFYANRPKLLIVLILQHRKNRIKRLQQLIHRRYIALAKFTAIHGCIGFPKQIEHRRRRLRGIQIVFEATFKFLKRALRSFAHRGSAGRKLACVEARREIP